jgi:D-ribose pyranase
MKKNGVLNTQLSGIIAGMGHTDKLVISDCGLPIPHGSRLVDLALSLNIPSFRDTLSVVLQELKIEEAMVADEIQESAGELYKEIEAMMPGIKIKKLSHEKFKEYTRTESNISFVRTGEATPYANIILIAGVTF